MTVTKKGYELAYRLKPAFPNVDSRYLVATCSKICRHAASLHRIAELQCSVEMDERETRRVELRETLCETGIELQLTKLSELAGFTVGADFNGDPRGAVVKLTLPDKFKYLYDCFGREGVCVPH